MLWTELDIRRYSCVTILFDLVIFFFFLGALFLLAQCALVKGSRVQFLPQQV